MNYKQILLKNDLINKSINIEFEEYNICDYILFLMNRGIKSINTIIDLNIPGSHIYYFDFLKKRYFVNIANYMLLNNISFNDIIMPINNNFIFDNIYKLYKLTKFVIIPITYYIYNDYNNGHANVLILHDNLLEHYDPHGKSIDPNITTKLQILYDGLKKYIPNLILKTSEQIHNNNKGFQAIECESKINVQDGGGSCVAWCSLFCEFVLNNKKMNCEQIINNVSNIFEINKIDLRHIITGYRNIHLKNLDDFNYNNQAYYHLHYYDEYIKKKL